MRLDGGSYKKVLGGAACLLFAGAYILYPGGRPVEQFGGVRLIYDFDFAEARELGRISESEFELQDHLLHESSAIIHDRVYGSGHIFSSIRPVDARNRVVIEVPFTSPDELGPQSTLRALIEDLGELSFYIENDFSQFGPSTDATIERNKLESWLVTNPGRPIRDFNRLASVDGGPAEGLRWYPQIHDGGGPAIHIPVTIPSEEFRFTGEDLDTVGVSQDNNGRPAIGFLMKSSRRNAFGEFTEANKLRNMTIVLNDEVVTNPQLQGGLYGDSIIQGGAGVGFTIDEVTTLVQVLRSSPLPVRPILISEEHIGSKGLVRTILSILFACLGVCVAVGVLITSLPRSETNARPTCRSRRLPD